MTREQIQREPRCQNSWRPSDGPLSPQAGGLRLRRRSPLQSESTTPSRTRAQVSQPVCTQPSRTGYDVFTASTQPYDQRSKPITVHDAPEQGSSQVFKNPNLIPVVPRRKQSATALPPEAGRQLDEELEQARLPQIWNPAIDDIVRRTAHDYDMVMNYKRDAEGGQRWMPEDVATIRDVGKHLHRDIFFLRRWQRVVAEEGDQNKNMIIQIKRDANLVKLQCERVQRAINKYEQKCEFELLRDGVYAQDEDGNFYRPTAPQRHMTAGGFLRDVARSSIESTGHDTSNRQYARDKSAYHSDDHHDYTPASTSRFQTPPESQQPKRTPPFDFTSRDLPFDISKREAASQTTPHHDPSDRVQGGRISKTHRDPSSGKAIPSH